MAAAAEAKRVARIVNFLREWNEVNAFVRNLSSSHAWPCQRVL